MCFIDTGTLELWPSKCRIEPIVYTLCTDEGGSYQ